MIVVYNNDRWRLDMPFMLFKSLKDSGSQRSVEITQISQSTYKKVEYVPIRDLEDYSIARNLNALRN